VVVGVAPVGDDADLAVSPVPAGERVVVAAIAVRRALPEVGTGAIRLYGPAVYVAGTLMASPLAPSCASVVVVITGGWSGPLLMLAKQLDGPPVVLACSNDGFQQQIARAHRHGIRDDLGLQRTAITSWTVLTCTRPRRPRPRASRGTACRRSG